jgi:hypothetical protein
VLSKPFQRYITSPQIPKISVGKTQNNVQSFSDYRASWSKEPQWEINMFFTMVFASELKESQASAYYWR